MGFWEFLETYSGAFIALLTGALVFTTIIYVVVSMKLLKQSKNALLADITLRVMGTCRKETKEMREGEDIYVAAFAKAWMEAYRKMFVKIDKRLGMDIAELFKVCLSTVFKVWEKEDEKLKEKEKEKQDMECPKDQ